MTRNKTTALAAVEHIARSILSLRGQRVLLDSDLAMLYGVETRRLNEQVRRNRDRFPADFIFELTSEEFANLKSQFATSSWGGRRKLPLAFTEHGAIGSHCPHQCARCRDDDLPRARLRATTGSPCLQP